MAVLDLRGVRKSFGDNTVLKGINLTVEAGQMICLIGASGSGKSTLLRCMNLLEPIDDGWPRAACTEKAATPCVLKSRPCLPVSDWPTG